MSKVIASVHAETNLLPVEIRDARNRYCTQHLGADGHVLQREGKEVARNRCVKLIICNYINYCNMM